jgi:hypothetical protein
MNDWVIVRCLLEATDQNNPDGQFQIPRMRASQIPETLPEKLRNPAPPNCPNSPSSKFSDSAQELPPEGCLGVRYGDGHGESRRLAEGSSLGGGLGSVFGEVWSE